ncbi:MAG: hypothetical protein IH944_10530 [Armatimonadetes bacterium]|nr:hypothetical protein [Armatimonadota bacterium]
MVGCRSTTDADVEGVWVGNAQVSDLAMEEATKGLSDREKRIVEGLAKLMELDEKRKPRLYLNPDHTFRLMNVLEGTWELHENQVTLTPVEPEQPNGDSSSPEGVLQEPIVLSVSKDRKTLESVDTSDNPVKNLVFTKDEN